MRPLFLGRLSDRSELSLDPSRLRTHGVVVGMTGSGKTGLCLVLLEELVRSGVPIVAIDPKGDLGNLGLVFASLDPTDFSAWAPDDDGAALAKRWQSGLGAEGLFPEGIAELSRRLDLRVYTPGSEAGIPVNLLGMLARPEGYDDAGAEAARELVADTVSGLLGLVGRTTDPVKDPAHVVLSHVIDAAWAAGEDPDLETLIMRLVDPPFEKVGVFPVDRFFPPDDRMALAMAFNGVVASPTFAAWKKGVGLDLSAMLKRSEDRTAVHVFSLAHLDESERQFFVSLLVGRLLAWSRQQPGTDDLRALLFFDEASGYLPPHPKEPPSKRPVLTMMKQSRAVGLGVVLATQNPVDVDYKALSNAGLWCIGRLNTEQDRDRLLKGLEGGDLDATVAALEKRQFLMHQVGRGAPAVFNTRHAMCFLRGPLTRVELGRLNARFGAHAAEAKAEGASASSRAAGEGVRSVAPSVSGVDRWFLDPRVVFSARYEDAFTDFAEPRRDDGRLRYRPAVHAELSLRFDEARLGFQVDERVHGVWFPLEDRPPEEPIRLRMEPEDMSTGAPEDAVFEELPTWLDEASEWKALEKRIVDDVYATETRGLFVNQGLKLYGRAGETEDAFRARCRAAVEDQIDEKVADLKEKFETKGKRLEDKIENQRAKLAEVEGVVKSRQLEEVVNIGTTLLSFFGGRKRSLTSAVSKRRQTSTAQHKKSRLEAEIERLEEDAAELVTELEEKVTEIREKEEEALEQIEKRAVGLEKNDIRVERFGLLWVPVTRRV